MANTQVDVKKNAPAPQPHDPWRSFRNELDRVFEQFGQTLSPWWGGENMKLPSVDITEDDKTFTLTAELPGLSAEDVDVSLDGRTLVIKGEKQQETKTEEKNYHLTERSYGAFERSFYLPDGVNADAIDATVAKGVLTVTLPKLPSAADKAKKITVKTA
ncbi:Hsp20/alpha crystallin family protein [Acidocella aromatica]|uniref:HSP20 family protein n=1 Tax=Acidocella aromatica TaxID=1303579 RepID=A0A840VQZ5_9PROT|nr:Hsp20/alpha crystallin family protein [Acidocella aromatica]MBB5373800.1 HSP20 family protein [Acidocella aromatica]